MERGLADILIAAIYLQSSVGDKIKCEMKAMVIGSNAFSEVMSATRIIIVDSLKHYPQNRSQKFGR